MPTPLSWPLSPDPTVAPPPPGVQPDRGTASARGAPEFLGRGLLTPFRRDQKNDFASAAGIEKVRACVEQILGTRASSERTAGELPWRSKFGSLLHLLRHESNPVVLQELARVHVADALRRWEPRVVLTDVEVTRADRTLQIKIRFRPISRNVPGNSVVLPDSELTLTL
jgi:phage baseplate assembly protein W